MSEISDLFHKVFPAEKSEPADFSAYRMAAPGQTNDASSEKTATIKRDPTQGQLDFAQKVLATGFQANRDGSYSLTDNGKQYNINYQFEGSGTLAGRVTDPAQIDRLGVVPIVTDAQGQVVSDKNLANNIAAEARQMRDGVRINSDLSKLPLDANQEKAFDGIMQAMSKSPPDLDSMNQLSKQFASDPSKFKNVFSAVFDELQLSNPNKINLMYDATKTGSEFTFTSPTPEPGQGWTNVEAVIPSNFYNNGKY